MPRPRKPIDLEQVALLAQMQCTDREIAAVVKCSVSTIDRRFAQLIKENRDNGKSKLRRLQWKRAQEGSDTMIQFMSKHYLEQHDPQQTNPVNVTVNIQEKLEPVYKEIEGIVDELTGWHEPKGLLSGNITEDKESSTE